MNNNDLVIKMMSSLLNNNNNNEATEQVSDICSDMIGKHCLVRTYSAGVWAGYLSRKCNNEIILTKARRLYLWKVKNDGISLSEVAISGVDSDDSKICSPVDQVWLEAIEIIPTSSESENNIKNQKEYRVS